MKKLGSSVSISPNLIVFAGLSGTGKTTVSRILARRLSIQFICKDDLKAILATAYGKAPSKVITVMKKLAETQIKEGLDVIVDSTFAYRNDRKWFERCEEKYGANVILVECTASLETRRQRISTRERHNCHRDKDESILKNLKRYKFNLSWRESKSFKIDTETSVQENLDFLLTRLPQAIEASTSYIPFETADSR